MLNIKISSIIVSILLVVEKVSAHFGEGKSPEPASTLQRRVCYITNWAPYRKISPILYPDDIGFLFSTSKLQAFFKNNFTKKLIQQTQLYVLTFTTHSPKSILSR